VDRTTVVDVRPVDPGGAHAAAMAGALWSEIQSRYGFVAPDPFDPGSFAPPVGGFWVALHDGRPVGSIALTPLDAGRAEVDVMYVDPAQRRQGVAQALMAALESHARYAGVAEIVLRAGEPQPEALAFYRAAGFTPMERFGQWAGDDTALCLRKPLDGIDPPLDNPTGAE
jgi:GNAT superfamily N-acetyltransferase